MYILTSLAMNVIVNSATIYGDKCPMMNVGSQKVFFSIQMNLT